MPPQLWNRKYRIVVSGLDVSKLRCTFEIAKALEGDPNTAEVSVYNLSKETENTIIREKDKMLVEAGYDSAYYGAVFNGEIIWAYRGREDDGVTTRLTLQGGDGDDYCANAFINLVLPPGQCSETIIHSCIGDATVPIGTGQISSTMKNKKLARGKVLFGQPKDYLREVARTEDAAYYIDDEKVCVVRSEDIRPDTAFVLTPKTGLVGSPEQTEAGVKARCLLNPFLKLNGMVVIDASSINEAAMSGEGKAPAALSENGLYRIVSLKHWGDTRDNDWYTEFEAVTQPGSIPSMIESSADDPF